VYNYSFSLSLLPCVCICLLLAFTQGEDTPPGALEVIVQNAQAELIMHPRIIDLVHRKWECFARRIFFRRFLVTLIYLLVFLITTILDQTRIEVVNALYQENICG